MKRFSSPRACAQVKSPPTDPKGTSSSAITIRNYLKENTPRLKSCYEEALVADPNFRIQMSVQVDIGPSGSVDGLCFYDSTVDIKNAFGECLVGEMSAWRFPSHEKLTVQFPLVFLRTER
jgi:hypothetical protein